MASQAPVLNILASIMVGYSLMFLGTFVSCAGSTGGGIKMVRATIPATVIAAVMVLFVPQFWRK